MTVMKQGANDYLLKDRGEIMRAETAWFDQPRSCAC